MTTHDDSGPAFPSRTSTVLWKEGRAEATTMVEEGFRGMSLRVYLAGQAMAGDFAGQRVQVEIPDLILRERAQLYLRATDALLAALKEPKP